MSGRHIARRGLIAGSALLLSLARPAPRRQRNRMASLSLSAANSRSGRRNSKSGTTKLKTSRLAIHA